MAFGIDDIVFGVATGGVYNAAKAVTGGYDNNSEASVSYPEGPDYSEAMRIASDNSKDVALAQIMGMRFAMQQAGLDRDMQRAASLELSLEKYDTKLQVGLLGFRQAMTAEENRHTEQIAADAARFGRMTASTADFTDIPSPEFEF